MKRKKNEPKSSKIKRKKNLRERNEPKLGLESKLNQDATVAEIKRKKEIKRKREREKQAKERKQAERMCCHLRWPFEGQSYNHQERR